MPNRAILNACARCNPHGFGFASESDYYKTMEYDKFLYRLSRVSKDEACIIHFRLATTGSKRRANCHPFKLRNLFFMHNCVLPICTDNDKTDSETAFRRYLARPAARYGIHSSKLRGAVETIIGTSKFAFMCDGEIQEFGQFTEIDGLHFSNTRWWHYVR